MRKVKVSLTFAAVGALTSSAAAAQVLEIGPGGAVTTYAGPAVITSEGARPLSAAPALPVEVEREVAAAAAAQGVRPEVARAVAVRESGLRTAARSPRGAVGVMQLMPATARDLGVDATDPHQNIAGGVAYLAQLGRRYGGDLALTLAAYNAGPGAVRRYGGAPPYAETRAYVRAIMARLAASPAAPPVGAEIDAIGSTP